MLTFVEVRKLPASDHHVEHTAHITNQPNQVTLIHPLIPSFLHSFIYSLLASRVHASSHLHSPLHIHTHARLDFSSILGRTSSPISLLVLLNRLQIVQCVAEDLLSCNLYVGVVPILQFFRWCCSWEPHVGQSWSFSNTI